MGFRLEFDVVNQVLLILYEGEITDQTIRECSETIRAAKLAPPICLIDFRGVTIPDVSTDLIKWLANRLPPEGSGSTMQVTIAPQDLIFGLSRMWGIMGEGIWQNTHVVRTMEEALAYIGVESPSFSPLRLDLSKAESDQSSPFH